MSFPAFPDYKDSGVEWVGPIPSAWDARPLFSVADEIDEKNVGLIENNLLSLSYGNIIRKDIEGADGLLPASFETYQILEKYDVVWRLTDLQNDKRSLRTGLVGERGIITSAYLGTRPRSIDPIYFAYLLRAYDLTKVFYSMGGGLRQSMKFSDVKWLPILVPPQIDQFAITKFLDRETAKIDAAVAAQERLIGLLVENRAATISHAVTKGLNPDAPMKDSGIEWLGQIPAHWPISRVSRHFDIGMGQTILSSELKEGGQWPVYSATEGDHFFGYIDDANVQLDAGDLVIPARGNSIGHAKLVESKATTTQTTIYTKLRLHEEIVTDFVYWYYKGNRAYLFPFTQTAIPQITTAEVGANPLPLPPIDEQRKISARCEANWAKFDQLITRAQDAIDLMTERRAALISAAVTGKIDVRGEVAAQEQEAA